MRVIGIDPGKSGAIALVHDRAAIWVKSCPIIKPKKGKSQYDERAMAKIISDETDGEFIMNPLTTRRGIPAPRIDLVVIESVHAMPGQGVSSMFNFGMGFGIWLGILASKSIPYELVTPQRWKKDMLADIPGDDKKARSVIAAKRMFPDLEFPLKKDHDKAEAVLLAAWGTRKYGRQDRG